MGYELINPPGLWIGACESLAVDSEENALVECMSADECQSQWQQFGALKGGYFNTNHCFLKYQKLFFRSFF